MEIDKRILNLSFSSIKLLHTCPRKFQIYRMNGKVPGQDDERQTITFDYGHIVGKGVQDVFEDKPLGECLLNAFLGWSVDLLAVDEKRNKSFFGACYAITQLWNARNSNGFLKDYELVQFQGRPACELSFSIALPDGFIYRGFVDAVLRHRSTGKIVVLESKTITASKVNPSEYKNSSQAIGYSIVLDVIEPELSSYDVYYLVYPTKAAEWVIIPFEKTYYQRALWIRELLLEVEKIKLFEEAQIYPMHGENCFDFFRECEYMQTCTLSTHHLVEPLSEEGSKKIDEELEKFQIKISLVDLIESQLKKSGKEQAPKEIQTLDEML